MNDPYGRHYGYPLLAAAGVRSGTLYPILDRFLADGWLGDDWELPDEATAKKPRRYYTLTDKGRIELGALVSANVSVDQVGGLVLP